ncbi:MAG: endonuclease/exonuclease/phosphatase family protein, partial [Actinomycetota bacterium]
MQLRVVTYNVRGFRDGLDRVANVVSHFEPDVVLLNETGGRLALRRFARAVGMELAPDPWSPFRRRVKDAVLARSPWHIASSRQRRFPTASRLYPRGALVAELRRAGARIHAISTHLSLHPGERRRHAEALAELVRGLHTPAIVGGDLNELPDGKAASLLGARFGDAWLLGGDTDGLTFPAGEPTARIDYLFVTEGIRVERAVVPGGPDARAASDHRPVVA